MTCNQLGGACEDMAEMSKQHGVEMFQKQGEAHLNAMSAIQELMREPEEMEKWFESKRKEF